MSELDGLNVERGGSQLEPIYIISEKKVSVASVPAFVLTAKDFVEPEELWEWVNNIEEDGVLKVAGRKDTLSILDLIEEIEDAFEYAGIDISSFE